MPRKDRKRTHIDAGGRAPCGAGSEFVDAALRKDWNDVTCKTCLSWEGGTTYGLPPARKAQRVAGDDLRAPGKVTP